MYSSKICSSICWIFVLAASWWSIRLEVLSINCLIFSFDFYCNRELAAEGAIRGPRGDFESAISWLWDLKFEEGTSKVFILFIEILYGSESNCFREGKDRLFNMMFARCLLLLFCLSK